MLLFKTQRFHVHSICLSPVQIGSLWLEYSGGRLEMRTCRIPPFSLNTLKSRGPGFISTMYKFPPLETEGSPRELPEELTEKQNRAEHREHSPGSERQTRREGYQAPHHSNESCCGLNWESPPCSPRWEAQCLACPSEGCKV